MDSTAVRRRGAQPSGSEKNAVPSQDEETLYYGRLERRGRNMALIILVYMVLCVAVFLWFQVGRTPVPVLVVSVPGFRWDYLQHLTAAETPFFTQMMQGGSRVAWLRPAFPAADLKARQMPLVTGLHPLQLASPEVHNSNFPWKFGLPIWNSAIKQWRKAALFGVPGGCEKVDGYKVQVCRPSENQSGRLEAGAKDGGQEFGEFLSEAVQLLLNGEVNLGMIQTDILSTAAGLHGASSKHTIQQIRTLEKQLSRVQQQLNGKSILDSINVLIVSDGGLTEVGQKKTIDVMDHLPSNLTTSGGGGVGLLYTDRAQLDSIMASVRRLTGVRAYTSQQIPAGLLEEDGQYPDVLLLAENSTFLRMTSSVTSTAGFNYEHTLGKNQEDMRGVFMACGPSIQRGKLLQPINARDVYPLLAALLDITPELHAGSLYHTADMVIW